MSRNKRNFADGRQDRLTRRLEEKSCPQRREIGIPYTFRTRYLGGSRFAMTACPATANATQTRKRGKQEDQTANKHTKHLF